MINNSRKIIFQHIPKTGGTSINNLLKKNRIFQHKRNMVTVHWDKITPYLAGTKYKDYFTFATHRNPWDRMVSLWKFWADPPIKKPKDRLLMPPQSFEDFCLNIKQNVNLINPRQRIHFLPCQMLNGHSEYLKVDYWIRFSHLEKDVQYIIDKFNLKGKLSHLNSTKHDHYTKYYNDYLIDLVGKIYKLDVDTFGYKYGEN